MDNLLRLVVGTKRTGKTTLARRFLKSECERRGRVVAIDTTGDCFPEYRAVTRMELAQTLSRYEKSGRFGIIRFVPYSFDDFLFACRCIAACADIFYVIEEASFFMTPDSWPDEIDVLVRLGGHEGYWLDGLYLTHQPVDYPRVVRGNADEIYFYMTDEDRDVEWARGKLHDRADELRRLPKFHYFLYQKGLDSVETGHCTLVEAGIQVR